MRDEEVFEKAIQIIQEKGWWGGQIPRASDKVCIAVAVYEASGNVNQSYTLTFLLAETIGGTAGVHLLEWNDDPARSKEDVILLLQYAAAGELETYRKLYGSDSNE